MILKNMTEVIDFNISYHKDKNPTYYGQPLKKRSNIPFDENLISKFGLPAEYINFLKQYTIVGVSLHTLSLVPFGNKNILDNLEELNHAESVDFHEKYVAVSSVEADNIVLLRGQHMHNDSAVYFKEHYPSNQNSPEKIADSFEQLVLIFSNFQTFEPLPGTERELKFREVIDWFLPDDATTQRAAWYRLMRIE